MKHPIHVCLVGADPVANLTPALDPAFAPDEVVLVVPDGLERQATWSQRVLEPRGIRVTRWPVGDPYDIVTTRERILELVSEREDARPALNASGGARPLSLAAYEVFRQLDLPVFYVHPRTDDLVFLSHPEHPDDRTPTGQIADRMKLDAFLAAYGAQIESTGPAVGVPAPLRALCDDLVAQVEDIIRPIGTLNHLAGTAEGSLYSERLGPGLRAAEDLQALVRRFERAGCVERAGDRLVFPDEERRSFVQGGWLEAHVFGTLVGLRSARPTLQDLARGVQIARSAGGGAVRNEIDVAFLADNRLHVIECKTACLERGDAGTTALYKLDSLADLLGGAHGRAMLVSFARSKAIRSAAPPSSASRSSPGARSPRSASGCSTGSPPPAAELGPYFSAFLARLPHTPSASSASAFSSAARPAARSRSASSTRPSRYQPSASLGATSVKRR